MNCYDSTEDTKEHIENVIKYTSSLGSALISKGYVHDKSKLESPEKEVFDIYTPKLASSTYGSEEYKQFLKEMDVALKHHYENNRHHPEHFSDGIRGMTLVDLCEMVADWKVATLRHNDEDILKSIEANQIRFLYSDDLKQILLNTAKKYFN